MPNVQRNFEAELSFAQVVVPVTIDSVPTFVPASSESANPQVADPQVEGTAKLHFNSDFSALIVEVDVKGDLTGDKAIAQVHLHIGPAGIGGPRVANVFPNTKAVFELKASKNKLHFEVKTELDTSDVIARDDENLGLVTNNIASLYNALRINNLYVDLHGVVNGVYTRGILRAQIYLGD